jgi:hypothetical protein
MNPDTGAITKFETDEDAKKAGFRSGAEDERLAFWRAMKLLCGNRSTRRALGIEVDK